MWSPGGEITRLALNDASSPLRPPDRQLHLSNLQILPLAAAGISTPCVNAGEILQRFPEQSAVLT